MPSSGVKPINIEAITHQLFPEQRFLIDIKFKSDHLLFPAANHIVYYSSTAGNFVFALPSKYILILVLCS